MAQKILVAEDDRSICELYRHVLEGNGYKFECAYDGVEALAKAESFKPDLVIMDVNMPQMNGWQLLSAWKASPRTAQVPVIMCTDQNSFFEIERALEMGAKGYITKPILAERILKKITEVLKV